MICFDENNQLISPDVLKNTACILQNGMPLVIKWSVDSLHYVPCFTSMELVPIFLIQMNIHLAEIITVGDPVELLNWIVKHGNSYTIIAIDPHTTGEKWKFSELRPPRAKNESSN